MAWPGLGKCTAYPRPGQDSPPLGVRWFSEGLGVIAGVARESFPMQLLTPPLACAPSWCKNSLCKSTT
jgi:hypothetical protein